jgi:hypothetical protein
MQTPQLLDMSNATFRETRCGLLPVHLTSAFCSEASEFAVRLPIVFRRYHQLPQVRHFWEDVKKFLQIVRRDDLWYEKGKES